MARARSGGSRGSRGRGRFALALVSLLLPLALAELGLRLFWTNPYVGEAPDRVDVSWMPRPGMDRAIDRSRIVPGDPTVRLRTDARGYTEPAFVHAEPDLTIAFFGGSTTANTIVHEELRFHAVAARALGERGLRVNALNAAVPGASLHDSLNVLLAHVAFDAPDVAVLMHATNDIGLLNHGPGYRVREPRPVTGSQLARWLAQMLSGRVWLVALARDASLGPLVPRPPEHVNRKNDPARPKVPSEPYRARLRAFVHLARDLGSEPVLMTQPLSSSRSALTPEWADLGNQDVFNAIVREVGREQDVLVIDLVTALRDEVPDWDQPDRVFWDGMHVNDEGSRILGAIIARELEPLARELAGRRAGAP